MAFLVSSNWPYKLESKKLISGCITAKYPQVTYKHLTDIQKSVDGLGYNFEFFFE